MTVTAENGVPEIPFKLINNHLILPVSVNGSQSLGLILDTGMPAPGLVLYDGPGIETLGLTFDPSMSAYIRGAGGSGTGFSARVARRESFSIPGLSLDESPVIVLPEMAGFSGYHDGIIGYSLFGRFVVESDYDRRRIRLHDPESWTSPPEAHVLPLTLRNNLPYTTLKVTPSGGPAYDAQVVIDLGASHAISLNTDESAAITVPERSLATLLGRGLSGPVEGKVGRIEALELAGARLENVLASFPVSEHQNPRGVESLAGNLGSEILRRFNTTFDYANKRMILQPNESFSEPFRFSRAGLRLGHGKEVAVERVVARSPAAEAGIREGDLDTKGGTGTSIVGAIVVGGQEAVEKSDAVLVALVEVIEAEKHLGRSGSPACPSVPKANCRWRSNHGVPPTAVPRALEPPDCGAR